MFITSARVKLWKFSKPIPTSSALAMAARLRSNSMATSFQPVVFSLGNPPLLAPLIPVQKTTPKKSKNRPLPPKKKSACLFKVKNFRKIPETLEPSEMCVARNLGVHPSPPVPPPPQRYHRQSSWHSPGAVFTGGRNAFCLGNQ